MLRPPINKLTFLKAAAYVLNFKLCPPPTDKCLAPLSQLLCRRLCFLYFDFCLKLLVFILFTHEYGVSLIIYCRPIGRQFFSSLIATLILIKLPSARHYIGLLKKIQRFCHSMVCSKKKHIEQQTQGKSPYSS